MQAKERFFAISPMQRNIFSLGCGKDAKRTQTGRDRTLGSNTRSAEKIFSVKVASVNTANRQGKRKRTRAGFGKRKNTKRAIVTLAPGSKPIDLFGAPA